MIEKEERYLINKNIKKKILDNTEEYKKTTEMLDISFYENGENLYDLYKYIIRIRKKDDEIKLEIKNYKNENECVEAALNLSTVKSGMEFLKLMNLTPQIYLKRNRTVREYKNLKIFIDEFDMIGDYVEIEYQDCDDESILEEFKNICGIKGEQQDMYGGIINEKLKDDIFKVEYKKNLDNILEKF